MPGSQYFNTHTTVSVRNLAWLCLGLAHTQTCLERAGAVAFSQLPQQAPISQSFLLTDSPTKSRASPQSPRIIFLLGTSKSTELGTSLHMKKIPLPIGYEQGEHIIVGLNHGATLNCVPSYKTYKVVFPMFYLQ